MAISLNIPKVSEPVRVNFKLREDLVETFNLYVKAAKETNPNCDDSLVLETILDHHLKRDKEFKKWLKYYSPDDGQDINDEENKVTSSSSTDKSTVNLSEKSSPLKTS